MRLRWLLAGLSLFVACERPARSLVTEPCCTDQLSPDDIRAMSPDMLYRAPGLWRFYDEFGDSLAPLAAAQKQGLEPLWRRTLIFDRKRFQPASYNGRNGLAVRDDGLVAVVTENRLWLLEGTTGVPLHSFWSLDTRRQGEKYISHLSGWQPVAAFAPDGGLWLAVGNMPAYVNLNEISPQYGPLVEFSWEAQVLSDAGMNVFDEWVAASQAVDSDGTLFWNRTNGELVALEPSGRVRWRKALEGTTGYPTLDTNGNIYLFLGQPFGVRPSDGATVWQPARRPEWMSSTEVQLEYQRLDSQIPVRWLRSDFRDNLAMHRLDGSAKWIVDGVETAPVPRGSSSPDGRLYLAGRGPTAPGEVVEAWDTRAPNRLWSTPIFASDGGVDPVSIGPIAAQRRQGAYVVSQSGRLTSFDGDGGVVGWYQLAGEASGYTPVLKDGVLYVLSVKKYGDVLPPDEDLYPGFRFVDGGIEERDWQSFGCTAPDLYHCSPPITGRAEAAYFLYAFRVE